MKKQKPYFNSDESMAEIIRRNCEAFAERAKRKPGERHEEAKKDFERMRDEIRKKIDGDDR